MHKKKGLRERFYLFLLKWLCVLGVVLIAAIAVMNMIESRRDRVGGQDPVPIPTTDGVISLYAPPTEAPDPRATVVSVTVAPTAVPTPEPEIEYDYLPIRDHGETKEKMIAITVDDLSQAVEFERIMKAAEGADYKLTLFPSGVALENEYVGKMLNKCVKTYGYEVENRGYGSRLTYKLSDEELTEQIWKVDIAVDAALATDYHMRYFRPYGASGTKDQRLHNYLKQLGYSAVVTWTVNGSVTSLSDLMDGLAPGNIYLFSSTTQDVDKMFSFVRFAMERGYRAVTLNELFGEDENELSGFDASYLFATTPPVTEMDWVAEKLTTGDCSYRVYQIQLRLEELGYLSKGSADGVYGTATGSAIARFQVLCGTPGTGICDADTQEKLFAENAPKAAVPNVIQ